MTTSCILFYRYNLHEYTVYYLETELCLVLYLGGFKFSEMLTELSF